MVGALFFWGGSCTDESSGSHARWHLVHKRHKGASLRLGGAVSARRRGRRRNRRRRRMGNVVPCVGGNFSVVVWGAKRMSGDIVGLRRGCGVLGRRPAKSVERLSRGSSGSRAAGRSSLFCPGRQGSGAGCGRQSTTAAVDGVFSGCQERGESHGEAVSGVWIRVGVASVRCGAVTRGVRARRLSVSVGM